MYFWKVLEKSLAKKTTFKAKSNLYRFSRRTAKLSGKLAATACQVFFCSLLGRVVLEIDGKMAVLEISTVFACQHCKGFSGGTSLQMNMQIRGASSADIHDRDRP